MASTSYIIHDMMISCMLRHDAETIDMRIYDHHDHNISAHLMLIYDISSYYLYYVSRI